MVATGSNAAIGEIASTISKSKDRKTPLKIKIEEFGDQLAKVSSI